MVYKTAKKVKSTKNNKLDPNGSIKTFMSAAEQTGLCTFQLPQIIIMAVRRMRAICGLNLIYTL